MVSAVRAEDSSSASANLQVSIRKTEWASAGILKVLPEEGPSFLVRMAYLEGASSSLIEALEFSSRALSLSVDRPVIALSEDDSETLVSAAQTFLAERAALAYLARAEQCRFQLSLKLRSKGHEIGCVAKALDYLESAGSLDDGRFAEAWLRSHSIHQSEGRRKLQAALMAKGIDSKTAVAALDGYFSSVSEVELCKKALEKLARMGKNDDKLLKALARKGFSRKTIEECVKERYHQ
jgi:regulatory protein